MANHPYSAAGRAKLREELRARLKAFIVEEGRGDGVRPVLPPVDVVLVLTETAEELMFSTAESIRQIVGQLDIAIDQLTTKHKTH